MNTLNTKNAVPITSMQEQLIKQLEEECDAAGIKPYQQSAELTMNQLIEYWRTIGGSQ